MPSSSDAAVNTACAEREAARLLEARLAGQRLGEQEALLIWRGASLHELGDAAHQARVDRTPPDLVTYVVDRNLNYTNVCYAGCRFCAFSRQEGDPDAFVLSPDEVLEKVGEAAERGATQILMQGGLNPKIGLAEVAALLGLVKSHFPKVQLHSLSPPEVVHLAQREKMSFAEVLTALRQAGLDSLPGGGAEILAERVRAQLSSRKCTAEEWLEVMRTAHRLGLPTTATMVFGHIETVEERLLHLRRLRDLQDETCGFTAFIPWTYQSLRAPLGGRTAGGYEYLRTLALSRLFLDNFANLQVSWLTQGLRIGQVALFFGANDMGGTVMEERVVRAAAPLTSATERQLRRLITAAGFRPVKRTTLYEHLE